MIPVGHILDIALLACHVITLDVVTKFQSSLNRLMPCHGCFADTDLLLSPTCRVIFEAAHVNRLQFGRYAIIDV